MVQVDLKAGLKGSNKNQSALLQGSSAASPAIATAAATGMAGMGGGPQHVTQARLFHIAFYLVRYNIILLLTTALQPPQPLPLLRQRAWLGWEVARNT